MAIATKHPSPAARDARLVSLANLLLLAALACSSNAPETDGTGTAHAGSAGAAGTLAALGGSSGTATGGAAGQGTAGAAITAGTGGATDTAGAAGSTTLGGAGGVAGAGGTAVGGTLGTPPNLPTSEDFVCSWVLGITTTGEWYKQGFEDVVDDDRWQVTPIEMGHLEKWADPQHEIWQSPIQSACTKNSKTPDRIVFNATKYEWVTVEEFVPAYVAVVENIKTKYPSVKRVDLITYGRAPGNMECVGANRPSYSYIKPVQDEAAAQMPGKYPGFVFVAPKWEHESCSDFGLCPHVSVEANKTLAKTIGEYFLKN
ncbi:MAG TPA: hypothetical protein VHP33_07715 [Polyangiaceae bacterium]|nr:hypothetical protein [Polyangiaceae bacterium]